MGFNTLIKVKPTYGIRDIEVYVAEELGKCDSAWLSMSSSGISASSSLTPMQARDLAHALSAAADMVEEAQRELAARRLGTDPDDVLALTGIRRSVDGVGQEGAAS